MGILINKNKPKKENEDNIESSHDEVDISAKDIFTASRNIYNQYISLNSPHTVNIQSETRKELVKKFEQDWVLETSVDKKLLEVQKIFDDAIKQIYRLMETDSFPRFKKSKFHIVPSQVDDTHKSILTLTFLTSVKKSSL